MNTTWERPINIIVLGDSIVGKTTLIMRYMSPPTIRYDKDEFSTQHFTTLGTEFVLKKVATDDKEVTLKIWDTAGQERFMMLTQSFYKQAKGIMLVYDVTQRESFDRLGVWTNNIKENARSHTVRYLLANKTDLAEDRAVSGEEGKVFAETNGFKYYEVSAKDKRNVSEVFGSMAKDICTQTFDEEENSVLLKNADEPKSKRFCC